MFMCVLVIGSLVFHLLKVVARDEDRPNNPLLRHARLSVPLDEHGELDISGAPTHTQTGYQSSWLGQALVWIWILQPVAAYGFLGACVAAHYKFADPLHISMKGNEFDSETRPFLL